MISEFSMHVKPKNRASLYVFLTLMTLGAFVFVFSSSLDSYRGVVRLVALAFFVGALFVYTKFVSPEYYYDITLSDGEPLLLVRQLIGKRSTVSCRIALSDIVKVELTDKAERSSHKTPDGYLKYNYTVTMLADNAVRLTVSSAYEKCEILLEGDRDMAELLCRYCEYARELKPKIDED